MKTKDLMIDDLVQEWNNDHTETHIVKVEKPMREGVYDKWNNFHDADWIEPIPLSTEILAKIAKSITKDGCRTYYDFSENFAVKQINNDNSFFFCEIKGGFSMGKNEIDDWIWQQIEYFHELQHALRFVGLNEVADNLITKLKKQNKLLKQELRDLSEEFNEDFCNF